MGSSLIMLGRSMKTQHGLKWTLSVIVAVSLLSAPTVRAAGATLSLVQDGKAVYTVVVPDGKGAVAMSAATMLADTLEKASGARLAIVEETQAPAGPKVFIGKTRAAEKAGLNVTAMKGLACVLKVVDGNLFLAGNDRSGYIKGGDMYVMPASKKAAHIFLRDYAGVRWLWPNSQGLGTEIPKNATISFPSDLNRPWTPVFDWVAAFGYDEGYEFNCSYEASIPYYSYGGHSHYAAVPKEKYGKDHPEYFAVIKGVRDSSNNHLCISNPEVQELLYAEMLKHIDEGFSMVELAQTDGYHRCECEQCMAIAGGDEGGERTWIVHNKLAQRLAKDRPDAKVVIIAYWPTDVPPKTIAKFGPNVVIELCVYSYENFERWRGKADKFLVYLYNWGSYHEMAYGPKSTPGMIARQVKFFHDRKVRGMYCCGFGESWGLEGPVYYVFNKCLEDPDCDWESELNDFYRAAFGKAYDPMKQMFEALYQRLEHKASGDPFGDSRWTPVVPGYKLPTMVQCSETHYTYYYPPSLLKYMESKIARAKELEPEGAVRARINMVERNFLYCQDIANVYHLYRAYQVSPTWESFAPLAAALKQRDARVREFTAHDRSRYDGFPHMFGDLAQAMTDGRGGGSRMLSGPFKWNLDTIMEKKALPDTGRRVPPFNEN